jgi:heme exporter protein D
MTGNSNRLLAILGNNKPAPWRGRYSLSRLFFNFYLLVMGSFVAIAIFADFVISTAVKGITDDYTSRFMRGTVLLIEEELFRRPRSEWPRTIEALDRKFAYRSISLTAGRSNLPAKEAEKLDGGELAIDAQGDIIYHRLKQTPQVLVVGPISPERNPEYHRGMPLDLRISLLTWSLIGVCLAIVVWLWVHPVWRDLEAMRQTTRSHRRGPLRSTRADDAQQRFRTPGRDPERHGRTYPAADRDAEGIVERHLARVADADCTPAFRARDAGRNRRPRRASSACGD